MQVIPAIDLIDGNAVRMVHGARESATIYSNEPWTLVRRFIEDGAMRIHVVDIDGAFSGTTAHKAVVRRIVAKSSVPIQVGGGLRDKETLDRAMLAGAHYAVLGTAAVKSPEFAAQACKDYPGRIVIAVDAKDGLVAVEGWAEATKVSAAELAKTAAGWGAGAILYTDVSRDGDLSGVNVEATARLNDAVPIPVIASGGVSSLDDIRALKSAGIEMVVVGRALYEKRFGLADAVAIAESD